MKTTYYLLLCGIFLFGCIEREEPQYYEVPLTMIVKIQNGIIDTVSTTIEDEYKMVNSIAKDGEPMIEFFKNGKNILRMHTTLAYRVDSFLTDPTRKITENVNLNEETSISFLRIDSIGEIYEISSWLSTKLSRDHFLIKNFPFEGINCFKREN